MGAGDVIGVKPRVIVSGRLHRSQLPLVLGSQPCTDKFLLGHFKGKMDQVSWLHPKTIYDVINGRKSCAIQYDVIHDIKT